MLFVDPDPEADLQTLDFDTENIHKDGKRFFSSSINALCVFLDS